MVRFGESGDTNAKNNKNDSNGCFVVLIYSNLSHGKASGIVRTSSSMVPTRDVVLAS